MEEMSNIFLQWLVSFLCGGFITLIGMVLTILKKGRKRDKSLVDGLQCLLRAEIIRSHEKYVDRKYCPVYAREALTRAYAAYHNLGGNDVVTDLYNKIMTLPPDKE